MLCSMGSVGDASGKLVLLAALLVLGGLHQFIYKPSLSDNTGDAEQAPPRSLEEGESQDDDKEDFALFTHAKNELHCMERELRHPCVRELRNFVSDGNNADVRSNALQCVNEVLESSTDYWELKNMTHLLLDLDTNAHVFDKENRNNEFVIAGINYAKKLMQHEECISDFDTKTEMETRCVPLYGKITILKYKNAGMMDKAKEVFDKLSTMSFHGKVRSYGPGEAIPWDSFFHTPQIWVKGLRSMPIWTPEYHKDLPIVKQLEDNFETLREETVKALKDPQDSGFEDAYRFLYEKGEWNHIMLYHDRQFTESCHTIFPKMCALLKQWLPSKPGLPWTSNQNEQAMVIKMKKGTDVETHCGPSNNILNIHIGISGLEGARLRVANKTYGWQVGKVIPWDGSYDHSVDCVNCEAEERVIMMVRYMHPDMSPAQYKGIARTHYEDVPNEMQV